MSKLTKKLDKLEKNDVILVTGELGTYVGKSGKGSTAFYVYKRKGEDILRVFCADDSVDKLVRKSK